MRRKICNSRFKKRFVVLKSSESSIALSTNQSPNALPTTFLIGTTGVVMIDRQPSLVWKAFTDSAYPSLSFPHTIKVFEGYLILGQPVCQFNCKIMILVRDGIPSHVNSLFPSSVPFFGTLCLRAAATFFARVCKAVLSSTSTVARSARTTKTILFEAILTEVSCGLSLLTNWASFFRYDVFSHVNLRERFTGIGSLRLSSFHLGESSILA